MARKLRTLLFSTLYPSAERPGHGIFVETRLRELLKTGEVDTRVVAPVPWFPSKNLRYGDKAAMARTPRREQRHGIDVRHPRYALIPKVGMSLAPFLLAAAARPAVQTIIDEGFDFDLIDAHYFYPDGVAAALLARRFKRPLVITARGSDVNLIAGYGIPRRLMRWAGQQAGACVGVSAALVGAMGQMGLSPERLQVLSNGVDLQRFQLLDAGVARQGLKLTGSPLLLSVGNLVPLKGHTICIDALRLLLPEHPQARLVVVGQGPERERLQHYAAEQGVAAQVHFAGPVANTELSAWYSAADVLLLASSREGWPNVLLEAMACGTPVVATDVGGVPEILGTHPGTRRVAQRTGAAFAEAVRSVLGAEVPRRANRVHAEGFGWDATSAGQLKLFKRLLPSEAAHA